MGSKEGKGGVRTRRYGLKSGSVVLFPAREREEVELQRIRETFDLQTLGWVGTADVKSEEMQILLYRMFLHLFRVTRTQHRALMLDYGNRAGAVISPKVSVPLARRAVITIATFLKQTGIGDVDVVEIPDSPVSVLVSSVCLGSDYHPSNSCYFLEGIIEGLVRAKLGVGTKTGRVDVPGISGCCIAVGRVRNLELDWLSEAVLSSPRYSAINRGRGRV